ncbi:Hsp90 co-chaperone Cdc37 [Erysiphe neolycopersici]|uniref:Hsp90 chaperone protein kinase-targeting subunit n=1 Tax=Erysiphe neolycopersici TaxID=212602 RepID=A0A420I124_9PEZI|nr:Hsp90 co-chaperone Cdc37 [Erysiphe neolycopersici]
MPVDYSKWDNLELSDDSDIEVHPNVDKKSFIRAKQNQIHQRRIERKNKIETYKYEQAINDGFLKRMNRLLVTFQSHSEGTKQNPDEIIFQAATESIWSGNDEEPPRPPACVTSKDNETLSYSKMLAVLIDRIKKKIDDENPSNRFDAYISELKSHISEVENLQDKLRVELDTLEKEASKTITSESYYTGFETSIISKPDPKPTPKKTETTQKVELLNPHALTGKKDNTTVGTDAEVDESPVDDDDVEASDIAKEFSQINVNDYREALKFISAHPEVVAEKETDGLLVMAFNFCIKNEDENARRCVHHGLLLQYCRALGPDGVGIFFKRITTQGHQAQKVFYDDVNSTFTRIRTRAKEIQEQRAQEAANGSGGVETIQLHAVDPGTTININIPPTNSEDPTEAKARKIFESFPLDLQQALESGSLDEVNKVLGKMNVEEAEDIVGKLGEGEMLSLEEQIIDTTTEEGQQALKMFQEQERATKEEKMTGDSINKYADDPE